MSNKGKMANLRVPLLLLQLLLCHLYFPYFFCFHLHYPHMRADWQISVLLQFWYFDIISKTQQQYEQAWKHRSYTNSYQNSALWPSHWPVKILELAKHIFVFQLMAVPAALWGFYNMSSGKLLLLIYFICYQIYSAYHFISCIAGYEKVVLQIRPSHTIMFLPQ